MNFLLGRDHLTAQGSAPPCTGPPTTTRAITAEVGTTNSAAGTSAFRFRVALGAGAGTSASPSPPPAPTTSRGAPLASVHYDATACSAAPPPPLAPTPALPTAPRYGGALVRVSDLQRTGLTNAIASSTLLHVHAQPRGRHAEAPHGTAPSPASAALPASLVEYQQNVPLSQLFMPEADSLAPEGGTTHARGRQKRARTTSTSRGRHATAGGRGPTRARRGATRGATGPIALQANGAPHESAWYTKQNKRYFVYDNKTYRGRQAYKVWKQVQKAEKAYGEARVRAPSLSTPALPPAPTPRQRPVQASAPVPTPRAPQRSSARARQAAAVAAQPPVRPGATPPPPPAQPSPLTRLFAATTAPMVKRPVTVSQASLAAVYAARPPAAVGARGTAHSRRHQRQPDVIIDVEAETSSTDSPSQVPVPRAAPAPLATGSVFARSFFDLSDDGDEEDLATRAAGRRHRTGSDSSISAFSSDAEPATDTAADVVTVGDWVYPRAVWEQMNPGPIAQGARGGLQVLAAQAGPPRAALSVPSWPHAGPPRAVASLPLVDRYEGHGDDGLAGMREADLEGMFDVAEEQGAMRFQ